MLTRSLALPQRRTIPLQSTPTLPPERVSRELKKQLESLSALKGRNYDEAKHDEQEWRQLTESIVERGFGKPSTTLSSFSRARSAGDYSISPFGAGINHAQNQRNFEARINALEAFLKGALSELKLMMPEEEIEGHYDVGDEYEFYRDIKAILKLVTVEVFIIDPYLSEEIFSLYAEGIDRTIKLRILSNNIPENALAVATKYASGGNLSLRTTNAIHDRLILIDD